MIDMTIDQWSTSYNRQNENESNSQDDTSKCDKRYPDESMRNQSNDKGNSRESIEFNHGRRRIGENNPENEERDRGSD